MRDRIDIGLLCDSHRHCTQRNEIQRVFVGLRFDMAFPEKFRGLIQLQEKQVTIPDYVWLAYAVCAVKEDSCGWRGWIIESAWKVSGGGSKDVEVEVEADAEQHCPRCRKELYRTEVERQYRLNSGAEPKIRYRYNTAPVRFTKPKAGSKSKT